MNDDEKVLYKEIVDVLKEVMEVDKLLPRVAYGRLKQMHSKYGMVKLHSVVTQHREYLIKRMGINKFESELHTWWYIDKIIKTNLDIDDIDEYVI